jgi:cell wall-associated NlpC family hydrolase
MRSPWIRNTLLALLFAGCGPIEGERRAPDDAAPAEHEAALAACDAMLSETYTFTRAAPYKRALLNGQVVATFTDNAYTVVMQGANSSDVGAPSRTFNSSDSPSITHRYWVRTLSSRFTTTGWTETQMRDWLRLARNVNCRGHQDILSISFEYDEGSTNSYNSSGKLIASDAGYQFSCDFHDYLGDSWTSTDGYTRSPDSTCLGDLDCSGYVRLVYGYRNNFTEASYYADLPLSVSTTDGSAVPRESHNMFQYGPGYALIGYRAGSTVSSGVCNGTPTSTELSRLLPGDLVFFDLDQTCGSTFSAINHVGIFVGVDANGGYRFISSRNSYDGPTIKSGTNGWSIFNGGQSSTWGAVRFRAARRL